MDESSYTNREIDLLLGGINERIGEKFDDVHQKLDAILDQTTRTNGRVRKLEIWRGGVVAAIAVIVVLVIPLVVYAFNLRR